MQVPISFFPSNVNTSNWILRNSNSPLLPPAMNIFLDRYSIICYTSRGNEKFARLRIQIQIQTSWIPNSIVWCLKFPISVLYFEAGLTKDRK